MSRALIACLILPLWLSLAPAPKPAAAPPAVDDRLDRTLTLPEKAPLPAARVFQALSQETGIELVASGAPLRKPITLPRSRYSARELLDHLADVLEGRWVRRGEVYVLEPPQELAELAELTPLERERWSKERWRRLTQRLRRAEWKRLRMEVDLEYDQARPELKALIRDLACYCYWGDRQFPEFRRVRREMIEKGQFRLALRRWISDPRFEVLSINVYEKRGGDPVRVDWWVLR